MILRALSLLLVASTVLYMPLVSVAHVPGFPGDGSTLDTAIHIEDPGKSLVLYSELQEPQEAQYFYIEADPGFRIRFSLLMPIEFGETDFRPVLVLMGPGLVSQGSAPSFLEIPAENGVIVVDTPAITATYEGFTPTSFYQLASIDINAPETGLYYVAVYDANESGRFGLVSGFKEEFSIGEFILVPVSVIFIHLWEGQNIVVMFLPMLSTLIVGLGLLQISDRKSQAGPGTLTWTARLAGVMFFSSGFTILYQMMLAVVQAGPDLQILVTLLFASIPLALGAAVFRILRNQRWKSSLGSGLRLLLTSGIALLLWAGLLAGPLILLSVSAVTLSRGWSQRKTSESDKARNATQIPIRLAEGM